MALDDVVGAEAEISAEKPLRVLFVVDSTFPGAGGAEAQARKLARALASKNASVEFVSPRTLPGMSNYETIDGMPCHRVSYPHVKFIGAAILLIRFAWFLFQRRNDYDVVHVHITRLLATVAVFMRPMTGLPVIAKISGYFEFKGGILDPDSKNPANAILRKILRKIDYVQTISTQTRERLLEAGFTEKQIKYIPNGIDSAETIETLDLLPEFPLENKNTVVFGYCGRLRQIKGVEVLLESFSNFVKTQPNQSVKLRIAGGGQLLESFKEGIKKNGLSDDIEFLGSIDDTLEFYKSLDVYIQPSFAEGLPNSVIEAMVCGLPVLATDIGGNRDLVDHNKEGWLFEAGDADALTALMQRCIDERASLAAIGLRGRERIVAAYDFSSVTSDLLDLYRVQ